MSGSSSEPSFSFRIDFPPELPISDRAEEIVAAIQRHAVLILAGETGSGKTTQIPKMCLTAGRGAKGRIACTQPRRVAALSISRRVAEELRVDWGREVGCKVRFNDQTTSATVIKFLTDGMLLAEVQGDPMLREYDTIILDEAHERSLNIDFLIGHLRNLRYRRPELKIIITSATIDTVAFSKAFDDAPVLTVEGRTYPVETIYAPLDSLGRDYTENDENEDKADANAVASARAEALHYVDGAAEAVERVLCESPAGDVLVFMPSERDIRETAELLEGRVRALDRRDRRIEIVPLFGRLSNAEQQRVFAPGDARKIVIATNIAETSLTIPGIRFVVDTGLARMSRYSPQARTRRLPIEPVSQSSADQRKGRCGRVADGVCIRLFSEKDYLERPRFTQPEIQRANLADVILRMKAFGLGDIERFPFINMPAAKSIRAGYALLEELGALEVATRPPAALPESDQARADGALHLMRELTAVGRELARLPVDPTVGRMILQARSEKALREVLVIAAGLSIQDPRERPLDKQQQADAAHRRFVHPDSDFLTLLNIWEAYHDEFDSMSQAKLRRFCRDHFLSYIRMREWRDIHSQLVDVLREREDFRMTSAFSALKTADAKATAFGTPPYRAIHRSILAGLLGNIAHRDDAGGGYKATHDRRVTLFPGSALFVRDVPKRKSDGRSAERDPARARTAPRWVMASEILETTRLYARTCARLDPAWAVELGAHLVKIAHSEPFWDAEAGRVMVKQRTRLYGLELETRAVSYGRIDAACATEIFIREALVNDSITWPFDFLAHNRNVRAGVESILTRTRDSGYLNLDEAVYRFYAARLMAGSKLGDATSSSRLHGDRDVAAPGVSSVAELVDLVRERRGAEPRFLMMEPEDLRDQESLSYDTEAFPPELPLENRAIPLTYAYRPGQTDDGVTLNVNVREAEALTPAELDWAVPGHLEAKVEHYLRALPKELRRAFVPLAETARSVAGQIAQRDRLTGRRETLVQALAAQLRERFRVAVDPAVWATKPLPDHLRVRVRVLDDEGRELCASRDFAEIREALASKQRRAIAAVAREDPAGWKRARAQWEKPEQTDWTFGDIPERVEIADQAGLSIWAFPGLAAGKAGVALRLFRTAEEAQAANANGVAQLLERALGRDLGWLQRDLKSLREVGTLAATLAPLDQLHEDAFEGMRRWVCDAGRVEVGARVPTRPAVDSAESRAVRNNRPYLSQAAFTAAVERAKVDLRGLVPRFIDLLREILTLRQALLVHADPYAGLDRDVAALLPADFLRTTPFPQLAQFPRYLKGMKLRADRWRQNPTKDAQRVAQFTPYLAAVDRLGSRAGALRWLVEEFRVSLFAQELGTAEPVSQVKLDRMIAELGRPGEPGALAAPARVSESAAPKPIHVAPVAEQKTKPLKNLEALDKLFPR